MKQILTLKIYLKLFFCLFISNLQWLSCSMWLIINYIGFNNLFTIFSDVRIKYNVFKNYNIYNYYLDFCFFELIIIAMFNMKYIYIYLPKINYIINYFINIEHYTNITPKIFIRASILFFATIIFYLLLPQLLWPLFTNKLTLLEIISYFLIVIIYIIFNVITATFIEIAFGKTVKTRANLYIVNLMINFYTLSLFILPIATTNKDLLINYILLFTSMAIITYYNYQYILKRIDVYKPQIDYCNNNFNTIVEGKDITIMVVFIIIFKIIRLLFSPIAITQ